METRQVLKNLINSITQEVNIISNSDDGTLVTLELDSTYWIMEKQRLTINGNEYKVDSLVDKTIVLKSIGTFAPVEVESFELLPPTIFAGTYRMVKHEVNATPHKNTINPMIWIREVIDDDFDTNEESAIDHTTSVQIYFVGAADYKNWLTEQHYAKVIEPLNVLVEAFLYQFNMSRFITDVNTFSRQALVNISVGGDQVESIFDLNLSGIEVSLTAEIRKDITCSNKPVIPRPEPRRGIVYNRDSLINGLTVTRYNYDEAWLSNNGYFDLDNEPTNPRVIVSLDHSKTDYLERFRTLKENNAFGNKNRFTDVNGEQVFSDYYMIDHLTGMGYWMEIIDFNGVNTVAEHIETVARSYSFGGFNDWHIPTWKVVDSLWLNNARNGFSALPTVLHQKTWLNGPQSTASIRMLTCSIARLPNEFATRWPFYQTPSRLIATSVPQSTKNNKISCLMRKHY